MPLEPQHEYSARIYAEILSSIGSKLVELAGPTRTIAIFGKIGRPSGVKDAEMLAKLFGLKPVNAAAAGAASQAIGCILAMDSTLVELGAKRSTVRINKCPYGDVIFRYKHMLVCSICTEYNIGMAAALGSTFLKSDEMISTGHPACIQTYECNNPSDESLPNKMKMDFLIKLAKVLTSKNDMTVSTLSGLFTDVLDAIATDISKDAALKAAKNAYAGGAYQGPVFAGVLELKGDAGDAAKLVSSVRDTIGCKVGTYMAGEGFTLYTKNCPQRAKCTPGSFVETACTEYTRGLLSKYGNYAIKTDHQQGFCNQEFACASPPTEGKKNAP